MATKRAASKRRAPVKRTKPTKAKAPPKPSEKPKDNPPEPTGQKVETPEGFGPTGQ